MKRERKREKKRGKNKAGISKAYQDAQDPCSPYRLSDALKTMLTSWSQGNSIKRERERERENILQHSLLTKRTLIGFHFPEDLFQLIVLQFHIVESYHKVSSN
jgi:hypothetical protein